MPEIVTISIPSHPRYLAAVRGAVHPIVREIGFSEQDANRIVLALDEACANVIRYAYEGDPTKSIDLTIAAMPNEIRITVRDTGRKPDVAKIVPRRLEDVRPGGLGTHFIAEIFDAVEYDTSGEHGTVLHLMKRKHADEH